MRCAIDVMKAVAGSAGRWSFARALPVAISLSVGACGGDGAGGVPFFFVHLSDPQLGMYMADSSFAQETANLELAVATANRLHPSFVIVTGDLVNQVGNKREIEEYRRIMSRLDDDITLYNVPGNHDVGNVPTRATIDAWRKRFGPDHYSFAAGGLTGIVLNSSLIAAPDEARDLYEAQEKWLIGELERAREAGRQVVVFQHHPWYLDTADEPDSYSNIPRVRRGKYLALLQKYGVRTVLAGHDHRYTIARDTTLHMIANGSVGKPRDGGKSGLAVVSVGPGGIGHRYFDFGDLPNRIAVH
jgi:3',5'-cyclic AMP phosphodiesterase CpdA